MKSIQELADEAFGDPLKKHRRSVTLRDALRESVRMQPANAEGVLAISVSNLEKSSVVQLELSFARDDDKRRPGSKRGLARRVADGAIDTIRDRFGWETVG